MKKWTARQKLQMKRQIALISAVTLAVLLLLTGSLTAYQSIRAEQWRKQEEKERQALFVKVIKPEIRPALLTPNKNSRPQTKLKKVNGIVVHYTANPGTDAMANRNYFESRKDKPDQTKYKVSSHFIMGRSYSVFRWMRFLMHQMIAIKIRFLLNVVIQINPVSFLRLHRPL